MAAPGCDLKALADALAHGRDVHRELFSEYGDERDMVRERLADRSRLRALARRALAPRPRSVRRIPRAHRLGSNFASETRKPRPHRITSLGGLLCAASDSTNGSSVGTTSNRCGTQPPPSSQAPVLQLYSVGRISPVAFSRTLYGIWGVERTFDDWAISAMY
jgi:hypothetical protein